MLRARPSAPPVRCRPRHADRQPGDLGPGVPRAVWPASHQARSLRVLFVAAGHNSVQSESPASWGHDRRWQGRQLCSVHWRAGAGPGE